MDIHVCKQCGIRFAYCRACVFKPIYYKDLGFCSKECYIESKKEVIQAEDVEVVVEHEDTSASEEEVEYPYFFTELEEENDINDNEQNYGEDV